MPKSTRKQPAKTTSTPNAAKRLAMYDRVFEALNKVAAIRREVDPHDKEENTDWTIQYKYVGSGQGNSFVVETEDSIHDFNVPNLFDPISSCYDDFTRLEKALDDHEERAEREQGDAELRERTIASLSPEQRRVLGLNVR